MTSIIFMGTPKFSAPILTSLIQAGYDVLAVVTQPDRKVGRKHLLTPSPVKQVAVEHGIEVLQPEKISGSVEMDRIIELAPDVIVTAAFGQFLPTKVLNAAKIAPINVHASLLPKYRGGAPVHYSIMSGDPQTGVSIIYMVKKMDAGDIIAQEAIPIGANDDVGSMFDKLSELGRDVLLTTLPKLIAGDVKAIPQDETSITFSPNISSEQEQIDITMPAKAIDWKVRGLRPFPTAYVILDEVRTKLWDVHVVDQLTEQQPGTVVSKGKHELLIAAGHGSVFSIERLQPAGKPQQTITDFLNGSDDRFAIGETIIRRINE